MEWRSDSCFSNIGTSQTKTFIRQGGAADDLYAVLSRLYASCYRTLLRNSLLGLKRGMYLPEILTDSPVRGFLPIRGGWKCRLKLPNPLISIRSPEDKLSLNMFIKLLTAISTSLGARYRWFLDRTLTRTDLVIEEVNSFERARFINLSLQSWLYNQNSLAKSMNLQRDADHTISKTLIPM